MLRSMRNNRKLNIFLWLVIIAFLATIFLVWGVGDNQGTFTHVAKVGDEVVTQAEYVNAERQMREIRRALELNIDDESTFKSDVLDSLIETKLMLQEAKRLNLPVSDQEIAFVITQDPEFSENGVFSIERYQGVIEYWHTTPAEYENAVRDEIYIKKLNDIIYNSIGVSDEEIAYEYLYNNKALELSYIMLDSSLNKDDIVITEEKLVEYHNKNKEKFRRAPQVKLKYMEIDVSELDFVSRITDSDVQDRYTSSIGEFTQPEAVELHDIFVQVSNWGSADEVERASKRIDNAYKDLIDGVSFETVARKYSDNPGVQVNGGNEGYIAKPNEELTGAIKIIFDLQDGQYSDILKTEYGYNIFMITNKIEGAITSFADAKDNLKARMIEDERINAERSYRYDVYREVMTLGNVSAYQAKHPDKFRVVEADYISVDSPDAIFRNDRVLKEELMMINPSEISTIVEMNGKTYLFELVDKKESYIPTLDDMRDYIQSQYIVQARFDNTVAKVKVQDKMNADEFLSVANDLDTNILTLKKLSRNSPAATVYWAEMVLDDLLGSEVGSVKVLPIVDTNAVYVVRVSKLDTPAITEDVKAGMQWQRAAQALLEIKRDDAYRATLKSFEKRYGVTVNPSFE